MTHDSPAAGWRELTDIPPSVGDNLAVGADFAIGLLLPGGGGLAIPPHL